MDYKLQSFIVLCETMNYRAAAEQLHLTQPAVTKQIQALERLYNVKLFNYDGKRLTKTEQGHILEKYAASLRYNYTELQRALSATRHIKLRIGATKTIGEYIIGDLIARTLQKPDRNVSLEVDNTHNLLLMLNRNELDFAIVEGLFNKNDYAHELFKKEGFTGICALDCPLNGRKLKIEEVLSYPLIVREQGSGTRYILESALRQNGYELDAFSRVSEISSFKLIASLCAQGLGISFVYQSVHDGEHDLGSFEVEGISGEHEFNIVYLKHTHADSLVKEFFA